MRPKGAIKQKSVPKLHTGLGLPKKPSTPPSSLPLKNPRRKMGFRMGWDVLETKTHVIKNVYMLVYEVIKKKIT